MIFIFLNIQSQIYKEQCSTLLKKALDGYNVSFIAFGPTGSGKTHLMTGTSEDPGIIPMVRGKDLWGNPKTGVSPDRTGPDQNQSGIGTRF